jgi:NIMA (never in mitosis gene a)-related kinase
VEEKVAAEEDLEVSRVGTPFYLAPELWKNPKYSPSSDIWALGVILYELCCLSYPFPATEMDELERKVLHDKVAKHPNFVSQDFVTLFQKMLNKNAVKRPCIETIIFSDIFQTKA